MVPCTWDAGKKFSKPWNVSGDVMSCDAPLTDVADGDEEWTGDRAEHDPVTTTTGKAPSSSVGDGATGASTCAGEGTTGWPAAFKYGIADKV